MPDRIKIALIGNPNTGKSTLFNALTGLNQKVGNFPGVTIDKKSGFTSFQNKEFEIIDLPGIYSLYPKSIDEAIVFDVLSDKQNPSHPDLLVIVVDASNLKRNFLLFSQVADLGKPVIMALNMIDIAKSEGIEIDIEGLAEKLNIPIVPINARKKIGFDLLKKTLLHSPSTINPEYRLNVMPFAADLICRIQSELHVSNPTIAYQLAHQYQNLHFISSEQKIRLAELVHDAKFESQKIQAKETISRYNLINELLFDTVKDHRGTGTENYSNKIDKILTHKIFGLLIFMVLLLGMFQAIYTWSAYPMDLIETVFAWLGNSLKAILPAGFLTNLLTEGIIAGLSGVVVFVPQIAILFAFIAILEDTGYMSRVTFMLDKLMKKVGLNGKSVVPLIGSVACAVPAIMAARTIENWKDRIITIMVAPLISCSARLPVYTVLIALVVPSRTVFGFINLQALALMFMYLLSFAAAFLAALVMKYLIKAKSRGFFIMELPVYRMPRWNNVLLTIYLRSKTFVLEAGKVIIIVSALLWLAASYGPPKRFAEINKTYQEKIAKSGENDEMKRDMESEKLESSFAGILGHVIEPAIKPLGFDWKIGIALITSFAAREVFVGTMATIYSVEGDVDNSTKLIEKMRQATNPDTGLPVFTLPVAFSLMIFYAFAMQCMSTVAVTYRETKSKKWPIIQFVYMTALAYLSSLLLYQLMT